jgi:hypothetical protein
MTNEYGKRYPGSGGARSRPDSGGEGWTPLPYGDERHWEPETKTVCETTTHQERRSNPVSQFFLGDRTVTETSCREERTGEYRLRPGAQ